MFTAFLFFQSSKLQKIGKFLKTKLNLLIFFIKKLWFGFTSKSAPHAIQFLKLLNGLMRLMKVK